MRLHVLQPNQKLSDVAALHGVSPSAIVTTNPHKRRLFVPGVGEVFADLVEREVLLVPGVGDPPPPTTFTLDDLIAKLDQWLDPRVVKAADLAYDEIKLKLASDTEAIDQWIAPRITNATDAVYNEVKLRLDADSAKIDAFKSSLGKTIAFTIAGTALGTLAIAYGVHYITRK